MRQTLVLVVLAAAGLAGCASSPAGPTYASLMQTMSPPKGGAARVVIMRREKGFMGLGDRNIPVKIDDVAMGELATGSFVLRDVPAGRHQLASDLWDFPGAGRIDFAAAPGRTYFFEIKVDENVNGIAMAGAAAGLAGRFIATAAAGMNNGGIVLTALDEGAGRQAVADLRQIQ